MQTFTVVLKITPGVVGVGWRTYRMTTEEGTRRRVVGRVQVRVEPPNGERPAAGQPRSAAPERARRAPRGPFPTAMRPFLRVSPSGRRLPLSFPTLEPGAFLMLDISRRCLLFTAVTEAVGLLFVHLALSFFSSCCFRIDAQGTEDSVRACEPSYQPH